MGNYAKAITYYKETIKKEEADVVSYYFLAEALEHSEMLDDALKNYKKAVSINDSFIEAYLGLARTYFKFGDLESAYENLVKATLITEPIPLFWNLRSIRLQEQGYGQLARFLTNHLIKTNPEESTYYINKALLNVVEDDYSEALKEIKKGLNKTQNDGQKALLFYFKGLFEMLEGNEEDGLTDFEFAILLDKTEFNNPLLQGELELFNNKAFEDLLIRHNLNKDRP